MFRGLTGQQKPEKEASNQVKEFGLHPVVMETHSRDIKEGDSRTRSAFFKLFW